MQLTFASELLVALPEMTQGTARMRMINKMLEMQPDWQKEALGVLKQLLMHMKAQQASDMDFGGHGSRGHIWLRVYGRKFQDEQLPEYTTDETTSIILSMLNGDQKVILFQNKNLDFSLEIVLEEGQLPSRFRCDAYYSRNNLVVNFRRINDVLFSMDNLEFPEPIIQRFDLKYENAGLYMITGITGSGKSSTLDTIVDHNNHRNEGHIVILGKPIEYIHESDKCLVRHREMGEDCLNFQQGVYQALRQDPDIVVVGEMRNAETIATVLEVTDTGHKVFTTLHTSSAIESIHRVVGEFPPIEQDRIRHRLADTLKVIVSQKLMPGKDGKYMMAKEILSVNESIRAAIRNNNINECYQMVTEGRAAGMQTLEQDLLRNLRLGRITKETAINYANNKGRMMQLLQM